MKTDWTCRHCEHWRLGPAGAYGSHTARAPICARGAEPFFVLSPADCSHYCREPGSDDELEAAPRPVAALPGSHPTQEAHHA